jgi:hypothetical protein
MDKIIKLLIVLIFSVVFAQGQNIADFAAVLGQAQSPAMVTGQGSQTTLSNNILLSVAGAGWIDTWTINPIAASNMFTTVITPAAGTVTAGNIVFEQSNDQTNTIPLYVYGTNSTQTASTSFGLGTTVQGYSGYPICRYMRCRLSTGVTGTTTGFQAITCYRLTIQPALSIAVAQGTAGNLLVQAGTGTNNSGTTTDVNSAASTNATNLKSAAGQVFSYVITNNSAAVKVVRLYNKGGTPVVGTDIPVANIIVPSGQTLSWSSDIGMKFTTGIGYSITGAIGYLDATAVALGDVTFKLVWQ